MYAGFFILGLILGIIGGIYISSIFYDFHCVGYFTTEDKKVEIYGLTKSEKEIIEKDMKYMIFTRRNKDG